MNLRLKYNIYPEIEVNELINCSEDPIDYIVRRAKEMISEDNIDLEFYVEDLMSKFRLINQLFGEFKNEEVVEGILKSNLNELTTIDIYKKFKSTYVNDGYIGVEVNAEIDLNVFKLKYDQYKKIEIRE
jgi:hypothetical protein